MKAILWFFILVGFFNVATAQRNCGTVDYTNQLLQQNPSLRASYDKVSQQLRFGARPATNDASDALITIPVVIHVLYNTNDQDISDEQVLSQLVASNQDYRRQNADTSLTPPVFQPYAADTKITFCLAQVDPDGKKTTGIIRKYTSVGAFLTDDAMKYSAQGGDDAWDCTKYLNIWVCNLIGSSIGYAALPGGPPDRDGVVVRFNAFGTTGNAAAPYNKGRTLTHEIGHWLGLIHTWGDAYCGDDSVSDTPQQETYNYGCQSFPHLSSCSPNANGDMFMNYMDFSDDGCMNMFTNGQKARMRALFAPGNVRNSFLTTYQCDSNLVQGGVLPDSVTTISPKTPTDTSSIEVYPNPAQAFLNVEFKTSFVSGTTLSLYNIYGSQVLVKELTSAKTFINISQLPAGIYLLRTGEGSNATITKIIHTN